MSGRRSRQARDHEPVDVGLRRRKGEPGPCGLCGRVGPLTKTHVPPQCAGNSRGVQRVYLQTVRHDGQTTLRRSSRTSSGGMHVYGLCRDCNSSAGRWDSAYGALTDVLRPCWASGRVALPRGRVALPRYSFGPSEVARSVLMGLFGANGGLRDRHPELADGLLAGAEDLVMPAGSRLRVALAGGTTGRLAGAVHTHQVLGTAPGSRTLALLSDASVYFPPLAWQLAADGSTLLDAQGWGDATGWLAAPLGSSVDLPDLCPLLPVVVDPSHDPALADTLMHLFSDEITPVVECVGLLQP